MGEQTGILDRLLRLKGRGWEGKLAGRVATAVRDQAQMGGQTRRPSDCSMIRGAFYRAVCASFSDVTHDKKDPLQCVLLYTHPHLYV